VEDGVGDRQLEGCKSANRLAGFAQLSIGALHL
jgi:hypothetical protein